MKTGPVVISNLQYFTLILGGTIAFGHFIYSRVIIGYAGRDGWVAVLLSGGLGMGVMWLLTKLGALQGKRSLVIHAQHVWGAWLGGLVGALYGAYFLFVGAFALHLLGSVLGSIYPRTPREVWLFFLLMVVVWAVYSGLEVIARSVQLLIPSLMVMGLLATALAMPDRDYSQLRPLLYHGFAPAWRGTVIMVTMAAEMIAFNMLTPYVRYREKLPKQGFTFMIVLTALFIGPITGPITLFGEKLSRALAYPTFTELHYINAAPVLERLDLFAIILWVVGAYFRVIIYGLCATEAVSQLTAAKQANSYTIPTLSVLVGVSLIMPIDRADDFAFLETAYPVIALGMGLVIPTAILLTSLFTQRRKDKQETPPVRQETGDS